MTDGEDTPEPEDVDRTRGGLTKADRRFLLGLTEYDSEQSARDARHRIRNRMVNAVRDLTLGFSRMEPRDRDMVLDRLEPEDLSAMGTVADYLAARERAERKRRELETELGGGDE